MVREIEEQQAIGRAARKKLPRNAHGEWAPSPERDVVAILREAERDRIPELLPIRHERMAASPFGFYRGGTALMARDLSRRPNTGLLVQICGDAHVRNLGAYASPEGHLVFDLNDFDETTTAPFEWDLLRFAASLVLAGREAGDSDVQCAESVTAYVRCYRQSMASFANLPFIDLLRVDVKRMVSARPVDRVLRKAERATPAVSLKKLTVPDNDSGRRFCDKPPLLRRVTGAEADAVIAALPDYEGRLSCERRFTLGRYRPIDVAFRVVGTGSVGVHDYVVLLAGAAKNDFVFLQVKEETASCYAPYLEQHVPHNGQRAAEGQHLLQRTSDPLLGWTTIDGRDYLVRQLNDHKASVEPEELKGKSLVRYAKVAGTVLALGHARTGEAAAIAAYCGSGDKLDQAITRFAVRYANQTVEDHAAFVLRRCRSTGTAASPRQHQRAARR